MKICSVCRRYYEDSVEFCAENHGSLIAAGASLREMIGNYRLDGLLERDAAGETYRATHTLLDKPVVVQIIASNAANGAEGQLEKLQSEARAAAEIIHPNVARVYESGSLENGDFYIVTEALVGQTLRERLESLGTFSESESVTVAGQTAEALAAAHAVGVIHRAVNPANIIFNADEENSLSIKLRNFDFGAIRQRIAVAGVSAVNSPVDAEEEQRYLSPEQCAGEAIDARTDVFSLGVVLYEMLCGGSPFDAPTLLAIVEKQINEQPLAQLRYDVRALVTYLLKQSLQTSATARLPSAANFARQLRQIEQLAAPPATMRRPMPQTSASKKTVSGAAPFSDETPAPQADELPVENFQSREIIARGDADAVTPVLANTSAAQLPVGEIKENTIDENNFSGEQQPILVKKRAVGSESFAAEPIFVERKQPVHVEREDASIALFESEPIYVAPKQVEAFSGESTPFVVKIPNASESFFVENEKDAVESIPAAAVGSPVGGVRMRKEARLSAAPYPNGSYVPSRLSRLFAPKQFPMLIGAALFALMAFFGLSMFLESQREESADLKRKAAKETSVPSATQLPRPTSDINNVAAVPDERDAAETEETAPIAVENLPSTASKRETQNQPRREASADKGTTQPSESVKPQAAREEPAAEAERADKESVEKPVTGEEQTKLNSSLNQWINATNARDVEQQMNYYAPKVNAYYQARNVSPDLVRAEKERVLGGANVVDIQASKPEIALSRDGKSATMRFRKKYAIKQGQKSRNGEVIQELQWVKSGSDWKIVSERDVKVINR